MSVTVRRGRRRRLSSVLPRRRPGRTPRTPFVLLVMALLGVGLVSTLWLSTSAASDSYELSDLHDEVAALTEDTEQLRQEVAILEAPGTLARMAAEQGMVPVEDPARLLVHPDGTVEAVGEAVPAAPSAQEGSPGDEARAPEHDPERQAGRVPSLSDAEDEDAAGGEAGARGDAAEEPEADDDEAGSAESAEETTPADDPEEP